MRPGNDDLCVCWQHGFDIEVSRMPTAGILLVVWYHVIDRAFMNTAEVSRQTPLLNINEPSDK